MIAVRDGLRRKAECDLPQRKIREKRGHNQRPHAAHQMRVAHQNHIPNRAHRAEAGALRDHANQQADA